VPRDLIARIPGVYNGTLHYYVEVEDLAGNVNTTDVFTVEVDATAPSIDDHTGYSEDRNAFDYVPIEAEISGGDVLGAYVIHDAGDDWSRVRMVENVNSNGSLLHYADCGLVDEEYLLQGDPVALWNALWPHTTEAERTIRSHAAQVIYEFPVDPARYYAVEVSYLQNSGEVRIQRMLSGSYIVHGPLSLPEYKPVTYRLPVAMDSYADGNMTLTFESLTGDNAVISEITVYEYISEPGANYLAYWR